MGKYRIAIMGIGGVGGYYGGRLALKFSADPNYEITFIARGAHKRKIESEGLKLELAEESLVVHPDQVTDQPQGLGVQNLILFCVKSYSLEEACDTLTQSINQDTVLLPLLNGIESIEYLQQRFPEAKTLWGCVYVVASKTAPGVVQVQGKYNRLVWGNPKLPEQLLQEIKALLEAAGINHELYSEVEPKVWEKFSFISPVASLTSLTDKTMGQLMGQEHLREQLRQLMEELKCVADAKGIVLPEQIVAQNLEVVAMLPEEATSSMQRDFRAGTRTELENLTRYIVREGERLGVATPLYAQIYQQLKSRS